MQTLYIIGNGFDLYHGLPTSYAAFHHYVIDHCNDLENDLEEYFRLRTNDKYLWTNFEEDLGTFEWKSFFDQHNDLDIMDDNFRPSFAYGLEDEIREQADVLKDSIKKAFCDWIDTVDISGVKRKYEFAANNYLISFNYTMTLEEMYGIEPSRILHIHGDVVNDPGELIFGHNAVLEEEAELHENDDSNRMLFSDSEGAAKSLFHQFFKPVEETIINNSKNFDSLKNLKNIYVLGHSINQIDIPYFIQINNRSKEAAWNVSYYIDDEKEKLTQTLIKLGLSEKQIHLFKL